MASEAGVHDVPGKHVHTVRTPGQATADTENTWSLMRAPCDLTVTKITETFDAAVSGAATDNFAHDYRNEGTGGAGTTSLLAATKTYTSGVDATAQVPVDLSLSTTDGALDVDEGEVISLVRTTPGTGLAEPSALISIEYKPR